MSALPRAINLAAQKPTAVPSYVRRFKNIQTNSNGQNTQNTEIIIPIDTGTPGAFLDPSQSFLQYDVTVVNQTPYADYFDFGPAGAATFIETMQIRSNGTPIETIRSYNSVFDTFMKIEGLAQSTFEMYTSRRRGIMTGACASSSSFGMCKPPMVDRSGRIMGCQLATSTAYYPPGAVSTLPQQSIANSNTNVPNNTLFIGGVANNTDIAKVPYWYSSQLAGLSSTPGFSAYQNGEFYGMWRNYVVKPGILVTENGGCQNPNSWPQSIGVEDNASRLFDSHSLRFQDYLTFLSNVRNIPIGCTTTLTPSQGSWSLPYNAVNGDSLSVTGTAPYFKSGTFTYTVNIPILSGLIGVLADKMAPTMLLDNFELIITTTTYGKAFKLSMDPCRRIPGTHRDYCVYYGNVLGSITGTNVGSVTSNIYLPTYFNAQPISTQASATQVTNGQIFNVGGPNTYTGAGPTYTLGSYGFYGQTNWMVNPLTGATSGTGTNQGGGSIALANASGNSYFNDGIVPQYYFPGQAKNFSSYPCQWYGCPTDSGITVFQTLGNDGMGCYGTYLAASEAQTQRVMRNTGVSTQTSSGNTPLTISYDLKFSDSYQGSLDKMPTFSLTNVYFVVQQVILPDDVTAEILQAAAAGDISIQTHTIQVWDNIQLTPGSSSQNIIIPAKVASANALYCIFKTSEQTNYGEKQYLVNSLCGYCPMASAVYVSDSKSYVGTNTAPVYNWVSTTSKGGYQFQLKIGNDLIPAQPITSISEIVSEIEKSTHGLNERHNNMLFGTNIIPNPANIGSTSVTDTVFDILADGGFTTAYVDPYMLADQTICNNLMTAFLTAQQNTAIPTYLPVQVGNYQINKFKHMDGGFMIGLDLDTFSQMSDVAQSGRYLGNNTVSLACEGLYAVSAFAAASTNVTWSMMAMISCDARWSFQAGGNSQVFY